MSITDLIGYLAASIGTFLMVPQVLKTLSTKRVDDISNGMLAAYLTQCALWGTYGFLLKAPPLILCNTIAFEETSNFIEKRITYAQKVADDLRSIADGKRFTGKIVSTRYTKGLKDVDKNSIRKLSVILNQYAIAAKFDGGTSLLQDL